MKLKAFLQTQLQRPLVAKAVHTFWQAALAYLLVGIVAAKSPAEIKMVLIGALGAGFSAVKSSVVGRRV